MGVMIIIFGFFVMGLVLFADFNGASPLDTDDNFFGLFIIGLVLTPFGFVFLAVSDIMKKLEGKN